MPACLQKKGEFQNSKVLRLNILTDEPRKLDLYHFNQYKFSNYIEVNPLFLKSNAYVEIVFKQNSIF